MQRECEKLAENNDGTRAIYIDSKNKDVIIAALRSNAALKKKFNHITEIILCNMRIPDLYDKEEINKKAKGVTAMKLLKGGQNARIYCKEITTPTGTFVVVAAEYLPKKKNQKNTAIENSLILKVASYEYEIK